VYVCIIINVNNNNNNNTRNAWQSLAKKSSTTQNWLPWQRSLKYRQKEVQIDHLHPKTLSFGEKIAKIGPADPEKICLREVIKKAEDKKERN